MKNRIISILILSFLCFCNIVCSEDMNTKEALNQKLLIASGSNDITKMKALLEQGADPNVAGINGYTPLHIAAQHGNLETIKLFLEYGADVNARQRLGSTPLHLAVFFEQIEAVKLLLEHGADINAKDKHGKTPLDQARTEEMKLLLQEAGV